MAEIRIEHATNLSRDEIRSRLCELMAQAGRSLDLRGAWDGDIYRFSRPGLDGTATVSEGSVVLTAKLTFPLSALRGKIESELRTRLHELLP